MFNINLAMAGFEPRTSGIGDRSTNWATTTARWIVTYDYLESLEHFQAWGPFS